MTALNKALSVEARGKKIIYDYLELKDSSYAEIYDKFDGTADKAMQKHGDFIYFDKSGKLQWVEVKIEEENKYGTFFIETLSNKNISDEISHYERASTPGWLYTSRASYIFYYFIKTDELYCLPLLRVKRWLLSNDVKNDGHPVLDRYKEKPQGKYFQLNDTWGRSIPINDVLSALGTSDKYLRNPLAELSEYKEQQTMQAVPHD